MLFEKIEKSEKDIVFVYTTCGSIKEARKIGLSAIDEKLAMSADYWMINSIYPWKNVIQEIDQCMLMFATQKSIIDKLIKHIEVNHSYGVPMIAVCPTSMTNHDYSFWVDTTLSSKETYITEEEAIARKKAEGYHYERLK